MFGEMVPVISSNLATVGYDAAACELRIQFLSGHLYAYSNVPPEVHERLMNASSKGRYFYYYIRFRYRYRRIS
ncbi:MAG: KTSC domain-containing protein [Acidimicrobiales bacterium]